MTAVNVKQDARSAALARRTISVLVENKPGILARIAGMFARRGFNIESLAVGPTDDPTISRMTIVVETEENPEQVVKQLNKLVHVLKIVEHEPGTAVKRELLLVKVRAEPTIRYQVIELAEVFGATIVDVAPEALTIEAVGSPRKIASLLEMLTPYGIKEIARTGCIALARGGKGINDRAVRPVRSA
jgi:acetolactate synthase I/III small subunit